jgi:RNA polymerase sigma-70 factor (ECF subfamily)
LTEQEFSKKVDGYRNLIFRLAVNYLRNIPDAEDITQEVFLKLLKQDRIFPAAEEEKAWIIRITINACKDLKKSAWYKRTVAFDQNIPFQEQEQSDVFYAVMRLERKYRFVIHLYYYEDYSVKEIAKILKIKESTIQVRLYRARKKLEQQLKQEFIHDTVNKNEGIPYKGSYVFDRRGGSV